MKRYFVSILLCLCVPFAGICQVDEIKSKSSSSSSSDGRGNSNGGGVLFDIFFNFMFSGVVEAQRQKLSRRAEVPRMVSLELLAQGAAQPSSYYILTPRARANWGLFSTDFRLNYLLEESFDGVKHIRTNDWQVLQLNLVTTKDVFFRLGGGVMAEQFGDNSAYAEWTAGLDVHPKESRMGGFVEYRDATVRREVNGYLVYRLFDKVAFHWSATAGAIYQRYYGSVNVWGLQTGLLISLY